MKSVRVTYELKIVEDVPVEDFSEWANGGKVTLEDIQHWEEDNLKMVMAQTESNLGGTVTGNVTVEALA